MRSRTDTSELFARYKAEQQDLAASRSVELTKTRDRKNCGIKAAKQAGRLKRSAIKLMSGSGVSNKVLYALTSKALRDRIQKINAQYLKDRQAINQRHRQRSWNDWLQHQAKTATGRHWRRCAHVRPSRASRETPSPVSTDRVTHP